jgi:iron complex outermembrane recepter protein
LTSTFMPDTGRRSNSYAVPNTFKSSIRYYSADIDGDLGWASVKSATSYSLMRSAEWLQAYYPVNLATGRANWGVQIALKKLTQEFRLASPSDRDLEWRLGIFFTDEQGDQRQTVYALDTSNRVIPDAQLNPQVYDFIPSRYQEYALFGDATWKLARAFDLTLGLRESHNEQIFSGLTTCSPVFLNTTQTVCALFSTGTTSQDVFNFAVSSRYHFSSGSMAYLRVASGYRPGGPNFAVPGVPTLKADTSLNTEVGIKSAWLDRRVQFNAALYQIDWKHIQIPAVAPPPVNLSYTANGNTATVRGFEAAGVVAPFSGLNLGVNISYTHAVLSEPMPENSLLVGNRGDRLPFAPLWSGSFTAEFSHALWNGWQGKLGAGWQYMGQRYTTFNNSANCPQNCNGAASVPSLRPYGAFDVHASISNDSWSVRFAGRNITNKYAIVDMEVGGGPPYDFWPILATVLSGRLLTVGVERRF